MSRFKLWSVLYKVNNIRWSSNYGASVFRLCTPWFAILLRLWDVEPSTEKRSSPAIEYCSLEVAWEFNNKSLVLGQDWYKNSKIVWAYVPQTIENTWAALGYKRKVIFF